jgi:hypothetical protein
MTCHRCHGFMCPMDLLVGHNNVHAWRCVVCGEIVDLVIVQNRMGLKDKRLARRQKSPRQTVFKVPVR